MKWGALFCISYININSSLKQVIYAQRLILLSSNMHSARPIFILYVQISISFLTEQAQHGIVAMTCSKMQSRKAIISNQINPVFHLFNLRLRQDWFVSIDFIFPSVFKQDFETICLVPISWICQDGKVSGVSHCCQVQCLCLLLNILEKCLMLTIGDQSKYLLCFKTFHMQARWILRYKSLIISFKVSRKMRDIHYRQIILEIWVLIEWNVWSVSIYHLVLIDILLLSQDCWSISVSIITLALGIWVAASNWLECLDAVHASRPDLLLFGISFRWLFWYLI